MKNICTNVLDGAALFIRTEVNAFHFSFNYFFPDIFMSINFPFALFSFTIAENSNETHIISFILQNKMCINGIMHFERVRSPSETQLTR